MLLEYTVLIMKVTFSYCRPSKNKENIFKKMKSNVYKSQDAQTVFGCCGGSGPLCFLTSTSLHFMNFTDSRSLFINISYVSFCICSYMLYTQTPYESVSEQLPVTSHQSDLVRNTCRALSPRLQLSSHPFHLPPAL